MVDVKFQPTTYMEQGPSYETKVPSKSEDLPHFIEPRGSLRHSKQLAFSPNLEQDQFRPRHRILS